MNHFEQGMQKNDANFVPLTPLSFLDRIKDVYPDYEALIYGSRKYTWKQVYERCTQFASALTKIGVSEGDVVSVMAANTPELFEVHYNYYLHYEGVCLENTKYFYYFLLYYLYF